MRTDITYSLEPEVDKQNNAVRENIPRIARLLALAIRFEEMIQRKEVCHYAELAQLGCVTRARMTQIMNLNLLAPDIQEHLLFPRRAAGSLKEEYGSSSSTCFGTISE